jgi:hypothetical protein
MQGIVGLRLGAPLLTVAGLLLSSGCASDQAIEKRLKEMEIELKEIQGRSDNLEERVTAVELAERQQDAQAKSQAKPSTKPNLKVVRLTPETPPEAVGTERAAPPADDKEPRPVIRATGSGEGRIDNFESEQKPEGAARQDSGGKE